MIVTMVKKEPDTEKALRRTIAEYVKIKAGYKGLRLELEEAKVAQSIVKKSATFIGIISGKGGVGKSSVAANIAYRMMKRGIKVGIIDADYADNPDNEGAIYFQVINLSPFNIKLEKGEIIGQGIIKKYGVTEDDCPEQEERFGGFGSTSNAVE